MSLSLSEAYQILELDPDAPLPEVRRSYRDLAQVWHPDRFAHSPRLQQKANRKLARINAAHALLVDRLQRPARARASRPSPSPGPSASPGPSSREREAARRRGLDLGPWAALDLDARVVVGGSPDQVLVLCPASPTPVARIAYRVSDQHSVSVVAHGPPGWLLVCSRWPGVGTQQFTHRPVAKRVAWMKEHYEAGLSLTTLAEDGAGRCVVVMSKGPVSGSELYRRQAAWPVDHARARRAEHGQAVSQIAGSPSGWHVVTAQMPGWGGQRLATRDSWEGLKRAIRKGWQEDRRVTSLAWRQGTYGVVLTAGTDIGAQTYQHTRTWPDLAASARAQWALGRVVTAACHDDDGWLLVWSEKPGLG